MRKILQPPAQQFTKNLQSGHSFSEARVHGRYGIEGPWNKGDPVHENITLAALYQVQGALGLTGAKWGIGQDFRTSEFLRGVFWNDDPEVLFFDQDPKSNQNFSSGTLWGDHFEMAKISNANNKSNLTGRSHFWDMQFLHGMACEIHEAALVTQQKIMMWAEFVYKVAIGEPVNVTSLPNPVTLSTPELVADTRLQDVKIPISPSAGQLTIASLFNNFTVPDGEVSIRFLLTRGDPFMSLNIGARAIGSLMHLIEDSYARGHVKRVLLNPQDLVSQTDTSMTFKTGTYGNWGNVITFHAYKGQSDAHKDFDEYDKDTMNPTNPSSFNGLVGANNAIDQCAKLLQLYQAKTPWEHTSSNGTLGPKQLLQSIFNLDTSMTPANILVNQTPLSDLDSTGTGPGVTNNRDPNYRISGNSAYVLNTPNSAWISAPAGAHWIGPASNSNSSGSSNTDYSYTLTVDMSWCNLSTMILTGKCAADDSLTLFVNGVQVANPWPSGTTSVSYNKLVSFSIPGWMFKNASNQTITFKVHNVGGATGLLVVWDAISTMKS